MSVLRHIVVTTLASACALAPVASVAATSPTTSTVTISGKGFGHGVGLSQDGDLELGREGKKMPQILGYFYPGTRFGTIGDVTIRAAIVEVDGHKPIDVTLPAGGVVRVGGSGVSAPKGGIVRLTHGSDGYHVRLLNPPRDARPDTTTASGASAYSVYSSGLEETGTSSYHGVLTVAADGPKLRAIDALPIETYLHGLGEVRDPTWPAASLQALAVAARSYALHSLHPGALFDVWSDDRSQVYLGAGAEYDALTRAVDATRGLVLTYGGAVADTVYSASGGGVTATAAEGFGDDPTTAAGEPYLTATRYPTADPLPWSVTYSLATIGGALAYPGTLTGLSVTSVGPSGRATGVTLTGSAGPLLVPGLALYHDLRLQSNLYTLGPVTAGGAVTATIPASTTVQGTTAVGAGSAVSVARASGVPGAASPHLVTGGATAPLPTAGQTPSANVGPPQDPTPGPAAAAPAAVDTPGPATTAPVAPPRLQAAVRPALASAPSASRATRLARPIAVTVWALALLGLAGGCLRRRRRADRQPENVPAGTF